MNKYKYSELHGKIIAKYGSLDSFGKAIGISAQTISKKLKGSSTWKGSEISLASSLLDIKKEEIIAYFFTSSVAF